MCTGKPRERRRALWIGRTFCRAALLALALAACSGEQPPGPITHSPPEELPSDAPKDPPPGTAPVPDPVPMRRLTRTQYDNTVRDLLGDDTRPARGFPADDTSHGFDNMAELLSVSPLLVEKYDAAAEALAARAWAADFAPAQRERLEAEELPNTIGIRYGPDAWQINGNGAIDATFEFLSSGRFEFSARAGGHFIDGEAPPRMSFRVDGRLIASFDVEAPFEAMETYVASADVEAGRHTFSVVFDNYLWDDDAPRGRRERALSLDWLQIARDEWAAPFDEARLRICDPVIDGSEPCARAILTRFARRAWRRSVAPEEIDRLLSLVALAETDGEGFGAGIQLAVHAVLLSPHFLFRVEAAPQEGAPGRVSDEELATRLSYFLWSSTPDDALLDLAASGRLSDPEVLAAEIERMLQDDRSEALVEDFAGQWLQLRAVESRTPDPVLFPDIDDALKRRMREQTAHHFRELLRNDRSVLELLDAEYTWLDDRLASHYGLPPPGSDTLTRVTVADPRRRGLLTHGSFLMLTSLPDETSPVLRGKWVLGQLLCSAPPPPPDNVPPLSAIEVEGLSKRERLELHRASQACSGCHAVMDPIGFGLENFDPVGRWREVEHGAPIDATGALPGGETFSGPTELTELIKKNPSLPACVAQQLFVYAQARLLHRADRAHLDAIVRLSAERGHRLAELVKLVARSEAFARR